MKKITLQPVGIIHSPFKRTEDTPIQPTAAKGVKGSIEIYSKFVEGLKDLDGFSHLILLYYFHLIKNFKLKVRPFLDNKLHGVFSTRAPARPNSIGFSIVELIEIKENILFIQDVDIVDSTPLLDIKPYVPQFDYREAVKVGWLKRNLDKLEDTRDDGRFIE